jgi:hypothetical protein
LTHYQRHLNLLINNNKVVTSGGSGIYLDDYANGVTVSNNNISGSAVAHVSMGQDTGTMHDKFK